MTPVATKDAQGQISRLSPRWSLGVKLQPRPYRYEWPALLPNAMVASRPELQLRTMSGSMIIPRLGSVLMFKAPLTIEGHVDAQGLGPCWCLKTTLPLGPCQFEWPTLPRGKMVTFRPTCCQGPTKAGVC